MPDERGITRVFDDTHTCKDAIVEKEKNRNRHSERCDRYHSHHQSYVLRLVRGMRRGGWNDDAGNGCGGRGHERARDLSSGRDTDNSFRRDAVGKALDMPQLVSFLT